jgi:hypothetical protein
MRESLASERGPSSQTRAAYIRAGAIPRCTSMCLQHRSVKATATLATWSVSDLDRVVDELSSAGVTFERYDDPALKADERGIHELDDGRVAWFSDPDGNTFAIEQ